MSQDEPRAHSLVEAYLYFLVTPCAVCGHGAHEPEGISISAADGGARLLATCSNCFATQERTFAIPVPTRVTDPVSDHAPLNSTNQPSQLIDVSQWLTLHQILLESAAATPDRHEARWRRVRARQCLDEALKFYQPGHSLPQESAFFTETSARLFRLHPERFMRNRVMELRSRLPALSGLKESPENTPDAKRPRTRWWRRNPED